MKQNWFYRKTSIRKLGLGSGIILTLTVIAEFFIKLHPHFEIESYFGFHAFYGFIACAAIVIFAKLLAFLIKRKDDYYEDR